MSEQLNIITGTHQSTRDSDHFLIIFSQDNISNEAGEQWIMNLKNNGRYFWEQ